MQSSIQKQKVVLAIYVSAQLRHYHPLLVLCFDWCIPTSPSILMNDFLIFQGRQIFKWLVIPLFYFIELQYEYVHIYLHVHERILYMYIYTVWLKHMPIVACERE